MNTAPVEVASDEITQEESAGSQSELGSFKEEARQKLRRLRRCKSVSRVEEIVTEDEKQRRAQPDKPYVIITLDLRRQNIHIQKHKLQYLPQDIYLYCTFPVFNFSIHKPRDSIMSFSHQTGGQNYEGLINWAFLLLSIGGLRLFLENINK